MIICSCNVLTDDDVRRVCAEGPDCARRVSEVYGCLNCRAECGTCVRTVLALMRATHEMMRSEQRGLDEACCEPAE